MMDKTNGIFAGKAQVTGRLSPRLATADLKLIPADIKEIKRALADLQVHHGRMNEAPIKFEG